MFRAPDSYDLRFTRHSTRYELYYYYYYCYHPATLHYRSITHGRLSVCLSVGHKPVLYQND